MQPDPKWRNRFFTHFVMAEGCWNWQGELNHKGYGVFRYGKHGRTGAHRAAWFFHFGPIPTRAWVLHRCDNPGCVNPDHLFLGDNAANVADKVAKGRCASMAGPRNPMWRNIERSAKGEHAPCVKLNDEKVNQIRRRSMKGESQNRLAAAFDMSQYAIWCIVNYRTWKHLPKPDLFDGEESA